MFDVGFTELVLLFVIGLLILGPERLPRVASQVGRWVGRARRTANQLKHQLEREVALDEMSKAQRRKKTATSEQDTAPQPGAAGAGGSSADDAAAPGAADPQQPGAADSAPRDDGHAGAGEHARRSGAEAERTDESSSA